METRIYAAVRGLGVRGLMSVLDHREDCFLSQYKHSPLHSVTTALNYNLYNPEICLYRPWKTKGYFQFEVLINVLVRLCVTFFRVFFTRFAGTVFIRQNLTATAVIF